MTDEGNHKLHQGMLPEHAEAFSGLVKGNIQPGKYILETIRTGIKNRTSAISLRRDMPAATVKLIETFGQIEKAQKLIWGWQMLVGGSLAKSQALDEIRGAGGDPERAKDLEINYINWAYWVAKEHGARHLAVTQECVFMGAEFTPVADARNMDFRTVKRYISEALAVDVRPRKTEDPPEACVKKWKWFKKLVADVGLEW